jgi:hypothetical protein
MRAILVLLISAGFLRADLLSEVPKGDRGALLAGRTVVRSAEVTGAPWPELSLYRIVNAPPAVVADLFTDYKAAPSYQPSLIAADVIATNADGSRDVRYTVRVPVIQKTSYVVRNYYERQGDLFTVRWKLLKSPVAKSSDGSLRIEPSGESRTILCYSNLCIPVTNLVAGLKNQALVEAKNTVLALAMESERRANLLPDSR